MRMRMGLAAACVWLCWASAAAGQDDPSSDPQVEKILQAMHGVSTNSHPDLYGMTVGIRRYAHRQFHEALKYFEIGAYYADKLSQLSIGLMYLNGEGVPKDSARAWAWLDLAAERGYPDFVATRDRVRSQLSADEVAKARAVRAELESRYGDAVAKHRMEIQLRVRLMDAFTGSRTGFDFGIVQVHPGRCDPLLSIGGHVLAEAGCDRGAYLAKDNWNPKLYFSARDREWEDSRAQVTVGAVSEDKAANAPAKSAAAPAAEGSEAQEH